MTETTHTTRRSHAVAWIVLAVLAAAALVFRTQLITWFGVGRNDAPQSTGAASSQPAGGADEIDHYTCTMHPSVEQKKPGRCPICGMPLVPVTRAELRQGVVTIPAARQQLIGVRTVAIAETPMRRSLRVVGRLAYDESTLSDVSLKVRGWIVKLLVSSTGQRVQKGQPLFTLYSPELYNAQQDFLLALHGQAATLPGAGPGRDEALARAARQRLHLLDMSDAQIAELEQRGQPLEHVSFAAPGSGYVIEKDVVEGAAIEPGMRLYRIASLNRVWIEADVYEADFAAVRTGQHATVTLDYLPGRTFEAAVTYVYPYLNAETRTGRVRLELANKRLELRPGMYASVELESDLGPRVQVPASAVVYTGPRRLVFVEISEGRFKPQEVRVGAEANGMYEVLSGLQAGDVVASSGVFLIAAEARIRTAATYWEASDSAALSAPVETPRAGSSQLEKPARTPARTQAVPAPRAPASTPGNSAETHYTCPMHPQIHSATPGSCPICGMTLVPAKRAEPR